MNALERLIALLVLAAGLTVASGKAQAAFPASTTYAFPSTGYGASGPYLASVAAACQWGYTNRIATPTGAASWEVFNTVQCRYKFSNGNVAAGPYTVLQTLACPANSTLSGGNCTCASGYVQEGSTCVEELDPQEELCNALSGTETYVSAPGSIAPGAPSCNATGCMTTFAGTLIRITDRQGVTVTEGAATFTGATCTYSAETGSDEDTCPRGYQGEVNGVQTCVPYDPKLNTIETEGGTESEVTEGGDTTNTSTSTTTVCNNGACSTTTTTTTVVNGGTPSTRTETRTEPQSDFCRDNPSAAQCEDASSFGGACSSDFTCSGDAVQCAQALAAQKLFCAATSLPSEVTDAASEVVGAEMPSGLFIDGPSLSPPTAVTGSCLLADMSIPWAYDYALEFKLSTFCPYMDTIRAFIGIFGALAFAMIVFRG